MPEPLELRRVSIGKVLTRTGGYLRGVTSHSLQPYRGCTLGGSLCGVACYVRANPWVTGGREWGRFLEVRVANRYHSCLPLPARPRNRPYRFQPTKLDPAIDRRLVDTEQLSHLLTGEKSLVGI